MRLEAIRQFLLPGAAERDEGFRQEILRISHLSLRVIGGVSIGVALFLALARLVVNPDPPTRSIRFTTSGIVVAIGLLNLLLARWHWVYERARIIAAGSGLLITGVLIWSSLLMSAYSRSAEDFIPGQVTLVMLVAVAAIPFRPLDALAFGLAAAALYCGSTLVIDEWILPGVAIDVTYVLFIVMLTLLSTGLTSVVYRQRQDAYQGYLQVLQATQGLRDAQSRIALAENAASLARLAAAISHELNTPLGSLISGVDTLLLLAARLATSKPEEQQRLVKLQSELRRSVQDSAKRLQQIAARIGRFTNLDRAEVQAANLNELLSDVAALVEPNLKASASLGLDLKPLPPLVCRPQQLSAVFYDLLNNAISALNGTGSIFVSTRPLESEIEVLIQDNGRGVAQEDLNRIFDPGFKVSDGRMSTGNWSMFNARQIIREHRGEIRIESDVGRGTTVRVTLPLVEIT